MVPKNHKAVLIKAVARLRRRSMVIAQFAVTVWTD